MGEQRARFAFRADSVRYSMMRRRWSSHGKGSAWAVVVWWEDGGTGGGAPWATVATGWCGTDHD